MNRMNSFNANQYSGIQTLDSRLKIMKQKSADKQDKRFKMNEEETANDLYQPNSHASSSNRGSNFAKGAVVGAVAGFIIGSALGMSAIEDSGLIGVFLIPIILPIYGGLGAAIGTISGGLLGMAIGTKASVPLNTQSNSKRDQERKLQELQLGL